MTTPAARPGGGSRAATLPADAAHGDDGVPVGVQPDLFKAVLRHHAKGVAVITAGTDDPVGFCATSLASLSLEPPLVSFTANPRTASWRTFEDAAHIMVHLLADDQEQLARRFGTAGAAKFGPGTRWHRGVHRLPVLDDALAWLALAPVSRQPVGDHVLIIGRVVAARHSAGGRPLIHHDGTYALLQQ